MAKTPRPVTDQGISIGQVFLGKYRVEEILGQGGMGIIARCTHLALNEQVAIKMLRPDVLQDEDAVARFMREAQAAVKLRSEYVARVSDVGTFENGVPYMVMEFLDGQDLGVLLEERGHVAAQWACDLMLQTCEALAEAHSISIVHRDVKPTNLFVTWRPDGTSLIKVLDFGISKSPMGTDMQLTQTQSLLGTPAYMSPEQMRSARLVDQRTDIWSLGTVMYELLEGRRPFEADSFSEMCVKVAVDAPQPMINAPPGLQEIVLRCLAKSPEQRYPNMAELGRDLIPFARDPHSAQMMVERMFRMLGRGSAASAASWDVSTGAKTPVPGSVRDFKSLPVRAQSPAPNWKSDPAIPQYDPATLKEKSAPAVLPVDVAPRKRRSGVVIGVVALLGIAAGAVALVVTQRSDEPATAAPAPTPVFAVPTRAENPPPPPPVTEPTPVPPPVDNKVATQTEDKDAKADAAVAVKKSDNKKIKKTGKKPVDKTVVRPDKDTLIEPTPPTPPPTPPPLVKKSPEDLYSKPRPDQQK